MKNEDRRAGGLATARGKANAKAGKGLDKADAASSKRYRVGGLATAGSKVPEQAAAGMAKAAEMTAGAGRTGGRPAMPAQAATGMDKSAAARARRPAYASGGYAGKTSTEARMCKPTAARAGASFKGGKK
jgi:hypothetical protein